MTNRVFLGLVHYPVYNKNMELVTTSVTNLDIHDIARCAMTYGLLKYYIIHPAQTQQRLINEIIDHWQSGYGAIYNPDRKTALDLVDLQPTIEKVREKILGEYPGTLFTIATDARIYPNTVSYKKMREMIHTSEQKNYLLLFGTGWGMAKDAIAEADIILEPIYGVGDYNHLSVRSAVAIILDRLLGDK